MAHILVLLVSSIIALSCLSGSPLLGQVLLLGEGFSIVLSGDPFKREEALNKQGHKGWEAIMAQQAAIGGLNLYIEGQRPAGKSFVALLLKKPIC